jgi:uncharacterized repeat protein (TIGR01451 family)
MFVCIQVFAVDLQISTFIDLDTKVPRGAQIRYQVDFENVEQDVANNVQLVFPIPATTSFVSSDSAVCKLNTDQSRLVCKWDSIDGTDVLDKRKRVEFKIKTSKDTPETIASEVSVSASNEDASKLKNNVETQNTSIVAGTDLQIASLQVEPNDIYVDETYSYILNVFNKGPDEATNVVVKHVLPSFATWVEQSASSTSGWSCLGSGTVTCRLNRLSVNENKPLTIKAKLSQVESGNVTATASISSDTAEINAADNQKSIDNEINPHADMAITLRVYRMDDSFSYYKGLKLKPNEAHKYKITTINNGPNTVSSANFDVILAPGITDIKVTNTDRWNCVVNSQSSQPKLTCNAVSIQSGASSALEFTAKAPKNEIAFINKAQIKADLKDLKLANNVFDTELYTGIVVQKEQTPKLKLDKSIENKREFSSGDNIVFVISTENISTETVTLDTLSDPLPDGLEFVNYQSSAWSCQYQSTQGELTCSPKRASLLPGEKAEILITTVVNNDVTTTTKTNTATITFEHADKTADSLWSSASFNTVGSKPSLAITKTSNLNHYNNKNYMGKLFEFKVKVTNSGGGKAENVTISDVLQFGYQAESVAVEVSNANDSWSCPQQGPVNVQCNGDISAGSFVELFIATRTPNDLSARPENKATVSHSSLAQALTAVYEGWGMAPFNPLYLKLEKRKFAALTKNADLVTNGSLIKSEIIVENLVSAGESQGIIKVVDNLPQGVSFVDTQNYGVNWHCSHSGKTTGGTVTCLYQQNVSGSWQGISLTGVAPLLTITTRANQVGKLTNTAVVTDDGGLPGSAMQSASIRSAESADLKVTKRVNLAQLQVDQNELTYTIEVENLSGQTVVGNGANALLIEDTFAGTFKSKKGNVETGIRFSAAPKSQLGAQFQCARTDTGRYQDTVSTIHCRLENNQRFAVGDKLTLTMTVSRPVVTLNNELENKVVVSSSNYVDPNNKNNTSTVTVEVLPKFDIGITLASYATAPILSGDEALMTLEVSNMSAVAAEDVVLTHTFDPPSGRVFQYVSSAFSRTGQTNICQFNGTNQLTCPIGTLNSNEVQTLTIKVTPKSHRDRKNWILATTSSLSAKDINNDINSSNNRTQTNLQINVRDANLKIENNDVTDPVAWYASPRSFPDTLDNVLVYKVDLEYLFDNTGDLSVASGVGYDFTMTPSGADKQLQFLCDGSDKTGCTAEKARCNSINKVISSPHTITCKGPENSNSDLEEFELRENPSSDDNIYTRYLFFKVLSRPKTTGEVSTTLARVFSNENDPISDNNTESEQTSIRVAVDLSLKKRASISKVAVGSTFNYFLDVSNAGPGDAAENIIYDYLSHDLELAGTPSIAGGRCVTDQAIKSGESSARTRVRCLVDTIAKGQSLTATIPVRLKSAPTGNALHNDAWIETKGFDINASNNQDDITLPLSKGNISGRVFFDANNDGVLQAATDSGISGITIELSGTNSTGQNINPIVKNTDANGEFVFQDLTAGSYQLRQSNQNQLSGYQDGFDSRSNSIISGSNKTDVISHISLTSNQSSSGHLFAETALTGDAIVEGVVFVDGNQNGVKEINDIALSNLEVTLKGSDEFGNQVLLTTKTDNHGAFKFTALRQPNVDGYVVIRADTPGYDDGQDYLDGINDHYAEKNAVKITTVGKPSKVIFTELAKAGEANVEGLVFVDGNQNGTKEAKDLAISNLEVTLKGSDEFGNQVLLTTKTDNHGAFKFTALRQPNVDGYKVLRADTPIYDDGQDYLDGINDSYAEKNAVKITAVGKPSKVIFTELAKAGEANVEGLVFVDGNQNGVKEAKDLALSNLKVTLKGSDEFGNPVLLTTKTDNHGAFKFTALRQPNADGYVVIRADTPSYEDGQDYLDGINDHFAKKNAVKIITVGKPSKVIFTELADSGEARVEGLVFVDGNQNGVKETNDLVLPNLEITLKGSDEFGNQVFLTTKTDNHGAFKFTALRQPNANGYVVARADTPAYEDGQDYLDGINDAYIGKNAVKITAVGKPSKVVFTEKANAGSLQIEGRVILDINQDQVLDSEDKALANILFELSGKDEYGFDVKLTTQSNSNGEFIFTGLRQPSSEGYWLAQGKVDVYFDGSDYLSGVVVKEQDGIRLQNIALPKGAILFTEKLPNNGAKISGQVYIDVDQDGIEQPEDKRISGVELILSGNDILGRAVDLKTTTDPLGQFVFDNLFASDSQGYKVRQVHPTLYNDGIDYLSSKAIPNSQTSDVVDGITLSRSAHIRLDFTERLPTHDSVINVIVFADQNQNGQLDPIDNALANTKILLSGNNVLGDKVNMTALTDSQGKVSFTQLFASDQQGYTLTQVQPPYYFDAQDYMQNTLISNSENTDIITQLKVTGSNVLTAKFTELAPANDATISGRVFIDQQQNGQFDQGDSGIENVIITLQGADLFDRSVTSTVVTNSNGDFEFGQLYASNSAGYTLIQSQPTDFLDGLDYKQSSVSAENDKIINIVVAQSTQQSGFLFTELDQANSSISGMVISDTNHDGLKQNNESGINNVEVKLTGTSRYGRAINRSLVTNGQGAFIFERLPPSDTQGYQIKQIQPDGWYDGLESFAGQIQMGEDDVFNIVLDVSQDVDSLIFAELALSRVSGSVFVDSDGDSLFQSSERHISDVVVTLSGKSINGSNIELSEQTNEFGFYQFTELPPSDNQGYVLTQIHPTNYADGFDTKDGVRITDSDQSDTIFLGQVWPASDLIQNHFTERYGVKVKGRVFVDKDDDAQLPVLLNKNEYEALAISDVLITLSGNDYRGDAVQYETRTNALGEYQFTDLSPSSEQGYVIEQSQPEQYVDGQERAMAQLVANSKGQDIIITPQLSGTNSYAYFDFAELPKSSIGGTVWVDSDENGILDDNETIGISGVTLILSGVTTDNEVVEFVTTSNENGEYLFDYLRPGVYQVVQTHPTAWLDGAEQLGSLGGEVLNDSFIDITLPLGEQGIGYNFAERGSHIAGTVYVDLNDDGEQQRSEIGLSDVSIHISGTDLNNQSVARTVTTDRYGRYQIRNLPLSDKTGFVLTETQPENTQDGKDHAGSIGGVVSDRIGDDEISELVFERHITDAINYNFGEQLMDPATISGSVWQDNNHNRSDDDGNGQAGWLVELLPDLQNGDANELDAEPLAVIESDQSGDYQFQGLPVGVYEVRFRHPQGGVIYGIPVSDDPDTNTEKGTILNIIVSAGEHVEEQSLPVDPSGVIYDVVTRLPVSGAKIEIVGPVGFEPELHLVGGQANVLQTTGEDGFYQFLLFSQAPAGEYRLEVTSPNGYFSGLSKQLPVCNNVLRVNAHTLPVTVHKVNTPPALTMPLHHPDECPTESAGIKKSMDSTQFYTRFYIQPQLPSGNVVNNHIPLDPYDETMVRVSKKALKQDVVIGELIPYQITINNRSEIIIDPVDFIDQLPAGFKYVEGSSRIDEQFIEPERTGRQLRWHQQRLLPQQSVLIDLLVVVGAGVSEGKYVNQAWAEFSDNKFNRLNTKRISNIAKAMVRVIPDSIMDCSDLTGQVFDDINRNGIHDTEEPGLPAVKLATAQGLWITTDQYGRYHLACADIPHQSRGSNFIIKVDPRSLPSGYRVTTENPRVIRLTRGKNTQANFAASIHRVARIQLSNEAFENGQIKANYRSKINQLLDTVVSTDIVIRLAYRNAKNESYEIAQQRVSSLREWLVEQWKNSNKDHTLTVEEEIVESVFSQHQSAKKGGDHE